MGTRAVILWFCIWFLAQLFFIGRNRFYLKNALVLCSNSHTTASKESIRILNGKLFKRDIKIVKIILDQIQRRNQPNIYVLGSDMGDQVLVKIVRFQFRIIFFKTTETDVRNGATMS